MKPLGPDPNLLKKPSVTGIAGIFNEIKAEAAAKEEKRLETGKEEEEEAGEDGEVKERKPEGFTLCEEEKRKIKREEKKRMREELKKDGDKTCEFGWLAGWRRGRGGFVIETTCVRNSSFSPQAETLLPS